ncbi:MAG TPA: DNA-processing protein DprA [Planctomicrobium sp.]|nr:DNA-processing protein DprA [Planctomicrobium sp.]
MHSTPDDESLALLQLNLTPGVGPRLQSLLLARFGDARSIFQATGAQLVSVEGIGPKVSSAIVTRRDLSEARKEWQDCCDAGIEIRFPRETGYPPSLQEICDPPSVLYIKGTLEQRDMMCVAIVGSRQCSQYGISIAHKLAKQLAIAGVTVVSGLARGIDGAAHRGALEGGGRTIAVCAPGLAHLYPPEHRELADAIIQQGALITESPLNRAAQRGLFPQRNRVISGMSLGVVIVEATRTSGSLHTARHAMEQGRDVFAVPGRIDTFTSEGCHDLIRDGATLVRRTDDILEVLGPALKPVKTGPKTQVAVARELNLNEQEQAVLNLVDFAPTSIDQVLAGSDLEAPRVLSTLTVLEMKRLVRRLPGGHIERITG